MRFSSHGWGHIHGRCQKLFSFEGLHQSTPGFPRAMASLYLLSALPFPGTFFKDQTVWRNCFWRPEKGPVKCVSSLSSGWVYSVIPPWHFGQQALISDRLFQMKSLGKGELECTQVDEATERALRAVVVSLNFKQLCAGAYTWRFAMRLRWAFLELWSRYSILLTTSLAGREKTATS